MALDILFGSFLGGLLRLLPEVLNFVRLRYEQEHELRLQRLELQWAKTLRQIRGEEALVPVYTERQLEALHEAYINRATEQAGRRWPVVYLLSALVRPTVTWMLVVLYAGLKIVRQEYTPDDLGLLSAVLSFWFVSRVWDRRIR